ncbi:MAG TPA: phenylalanine--tRNA ligase subunit beta [Mycobacteriales bacterium]|nr:phenylalanine--tRNA ligase subunit beta [Mycobacteriales bacterium]
MRVPLSWLVELVPELAGRPAAEVGELLTRAGVEVEEIVAADISGPVVVGVVREIEELTEFKKPIRWCQVDVGEAELRSIVCGATNFAVGDKVVVSLPGAVLPGGFAIASRKTYGHLSDGMICSARELGLGEDHTGIMVLQADAPAGADALELLSLTDPVLVTEPTPDRGYQLSVRGLARELAALLEADFSDPAHRDLTGRWSNTPAGGQGFAIELDDPTGCDQFVARIVRGVDPAAPSPLWMQSRLVQCGQRPISLTVDVTNYVLLLLGTPMHAYDLTKVAAPIRVRRARAGETLCTLDGIVRTLAAGEDLLITDATGIQGLAGVMGGADSEISAGTTDLLLEAAHFDPRVISRTVRRHGLLSEAGRRFERGVDPAAQPAAIELATELLVRFGGGTAEEITVHVGATPPADSVSIDPAAIGRLVGVDYDAATVRHRLEQVGCTVSDQFLVTPPTWRADLLELPDFAEEVARIDGYDKIPSILPAAPAGGGLSLPQRRRRAVSRALAYAGYVEVSGFSFQSAEVLDALGLPSDDARRRLVRVANPLSNEQAFLRSSLLPGLLTTLARNIGRGLPDIAIYENGVVFREPAGSRPPAPVLDPTTRPSPEQLAALDAALPEQTEQVAVAASANAEPRGWWGAGRAMTWADIIDAARLIVRTADAEPVVRAAEQGPWHPGRCAAIEVEGAVVGYAGELHPAVCEALELPARSVAAELDLRVLLDRPAAELTAPVLSAFPPATQDVALVVDAATPSAAVESALRAGAGELLEEVRLFDVYSGEQVGAGRKSLAYGLRLRARDRTLTVEEATAARDAAVQEATRLTGAVLRS